MTDTSDWFTGFSALDLAWQAKVDWDALRQAQRAREADEAANRFAAGLFEVLMEQPWWKPHQLNELLATAVYRHRTRFVRQLLDKGKDAYALIKSAILGR